ncbi:MAG: phospho-N-acetylmuramoyl-pentapeptide-transferase [Lachnospiraceae bacterium]|nr:phospho-N-acetylmuramoyl-pentapeptide-transferase [Lachnospiraceae bacterium]
MTNTEIISGLAAFLLSAVLGPVVIPVLRRIKAGQTEREDGPESHLKKTGTPTMGAFIFLIPFITVFTVVSFKEPGLLPVLFLTIGFAVVGFVDDFIKVVLKRSEGLTPAQKMALQIVVAAAYSVLCYFKAGGEFRFLIPFTTGYATLGWIGIPILAFIVIGTVNGSNFTDGVDGLEASVTAAICAFLFVVGKMYAPFASTASAVMFGALMGFLLYNVNKAKVFMGDTGSLALGGFVVAVAHILNLEFYLPFICLIYFAEVLSVIIQVSYFKITHGKRVFRMAPIHHHFELGGWSETKVVCVFTIVTMVICAFCLLFINI